MDTGASRNCISYNMFLKLKNPKWSSKLVPRVCTADGSDLGSLGRIDLQLKLGDKEVIQDFVVCRRLKCDVILGADFGKNKSAGVEWTSQKTRVLSLNGIPAIEVEENELGLPVTAAFHIKVPPRHNGVFQVNIHGDTKGTHIISANSQFLEKNPNVYQHEISIISDNDSQAFPLVALTNLDFAKTLHIGKGEIIGFARPESEEVVYIATSDKISIDPYIDNAPRNWIPPRNRKMLNQTDKRQEVTKMLGKSTATENGTRLYDESPRKTQDRQQSTPIRVKVKAKEPEGDKNTERLSNKSMDRCSQPGKGHYQQGDTEMKRHIDESRESQSDSWDTIHEVIESDF